MSAFVWLLLAFFGPVILYFVYEYLVGKLKIKKENELNALNKELQQRIDKSTRQISEIEAKLKETK